MLNTSGINGLKYPFIYLFIHFSFFVNSPFKFYACLSAKFFIMKKDKTKTKTQSPYLGA